MCPSNKQDRSDGVSATVMRVQAWSRAVASEWRCVVVDQRCRESKGKAKIEGYMSISDVEAHHQSIGQIPSLAESSADQ